METHGDSCLPSERLTAAPRIAQLVSGWFAIRRGDMAYYTINMTFYENPSLLDTLQACVDDSAKKNQLVLALLNTAYAVNGMVWYKGKDGTIKQATIGEWPPDRPWKD
jgi:hypothetical protein